jgi:Domain of unknown function (DUF4281)
MTMTTAQLFDNANLFVLPFWALMIFLPNWGITRRIMESPLPLVLLACLYIYLFAGSLNSEAAQSLANPKLADIARFFADENAAAIGWVHFLVMDLFVGRWIYWQGQQTGVWTIHSLILCLFAGPMGVLSHIITQAITQKFFPRSITEAATPETT